ncbi:hypothetical protein AB3G33_02910 [Flavobacterium sp. WC2421]|uniref:hypothetical protein n=1 Tax=unclassified Flavobacterium TaxID=196869 RepID=UPI003466B508
MKTEINKVKEVLQEILNSFDDEGLDNKISLLEEGVAEFFVANRENTNFFATFLNNFILKPIAKQIEILEAQLPSSSRTQKARREIQLKIIDRFKSLLIIFFNDYHKYLQGFSEYDKFIKQNTKKKAYKRDSLLSTSFGELLEFYSVQYFKKVVDTVFDNTFIYFKEIFEDSKQIENSKQEILLFVKQLEETIDSLRVIIANKESKLDEVLKEETPYGTKEYEMENGELITVELLDGYVSDIIERSDIIMKNKYQQTILKKLSDKLYSSFLFLQEFKPSKESPTTVFHSLKFEELNSFCEELRDFIGMQVKLETIKEVFTVGYPIDNPKINLINGTLNDFGFLISKMRPYFIDSIKTKSNYAQWWSERFTFNLIEKDKKNVSNMISNMEKGTRFPSKKQSIFKIIESLNPIPQ